MPQAPLRQAITKSIETLTSGMSSILSQISSLVQSEIGIQMTAAIEKRYEHEISMARATQHGCGPGNSEAPRAGNTGKRGFDLEA